jgi:hypothetical protein
MGEELLRSSVAEGLMGADGVVGPLPVLEFLVEPGDLERAGGDLIEFLRMGALGALDRAVEFGRAGRQVSLLKTSSRLKSLTLSRVVVNFPSPCLLYFFPR